VEAAIVLGAVAYPERKRWLEVAFFVLEAVVHPKRVQRLVEAPLMVIIQDAVVHPKRVQLLVEAPDAVVAPKRVRRLEEAPLMVIVLEAVVPPKGKRRLEEAVMVIVLEAVVPPKRKRRLVEAGLILRLGYSLSKRNLHVLATLRDRCSQYRQDALLLKQMYDTTNCDCIKDCGRRDN
jgi:hypothetical protein